MQRILKDHLALSHKDQYQCKQQPDCGCGIKFMGKYLFKIISPFVFDYQDPGQDTSGQRNDHKQYNAEN